MCFIYEVEDSQMKTNFKYKIFYFTYGIDALSQIKYNFHLWNRTKFSVRDYIKIFSLLTFSRQDKTSIISLGLMPDDFTH